MSRFLSRSKSTRELRSKFAQSSQEDLPDFPRHADHPQITTTIEASPPIHPPAKLRRRILTFEKPHDAAAAFPVRRSKIDRFGRLRKQQSMDSFRRPGTSTSDKSSQGTPIFPGDRDGSTQTPTILKGTNGSGASSRMGNTSNTSPVNSPPIGVAIGSPTERNATRNLPSIDTPSTIVSKGDSPAFVLPPEPFVVGGGGKKASQTATSVSTTKTATTTTTMVNSCGEGQEARGWKKLFGRSLFGSKKSKKQFSLPVPSPEPGSNLAPSNNGSEPGSGESSLVEVRINSAQAAAVQVLPTPDIITPQTTAPTQQNAAPPKQISKPSPSLLNVYIPTVEMERYSVMFQALLQRDFLETSEGHSKKASLFERRSSTKKKNATKEAPLLHLKPLKRSATTSGCTSGPVSPNPLDHDQEETPNLSRPEIAYSRSSRRRRSHTVSEAMPKLTLVTAPGHGFVLAGESIPTATLGPAQDPFDSIAVETPEEPMLRRSSSASKITTEEPSIATPRGSFDQGDDSWMQKAETESGCFGSDDSIVAAASLGPSVVARGGDNGVGNRVGMGSVSAQPLWELVKQDPEAPIPPMPDTIKTEEDAVVAAQISIARQISVSHRQLLHFPLGGARVVNVAGTKASGEKKKVGGVGAAGRAAQVGDEVIGEVMALKRAQSVKVSSPRIVSPQADVRGHKVTGSLNVEYGDLTRLSMVEIGLKKSPAPAAPAAQDG